MQHSNMRGVRRFMLIALSVLVAASGCAKTAPEQAVRQQLEALQTAIDARDAGDVQALLAEDFVGNEGIDRRGARQLAVAVFLQHRNVGARIGPVTVELRGESEATAKFTVLVTGGSGSLLPESGQVFNVETGWRLVDGDWRLLNARWTPKL